jgi:hydroxyacyl-ACP dehydratase HTD2-like protein with hotdog domain
MLLEIVRCNGDAPVRTFQFRAIKPVFVTASFVVCARPLAARHLPLLVQDKEGFARIEAKVTMDA